MTPLTSTARRFADPLRAGAPRIVVIFRNDDPSGCSDVDHERRIAEMFDRYGLRQTLGVIPLSAADSTHDPSGTQYTQLAANPAMVRFLIDYAARSGSELALHGFTHRTNRYSQPRKREYFEFKRIGLAEQEDLIARGADTLARVLGVRPQTFIPPWNRLDVNTMRACANQGLAVVSAGPFVPPVPGVLPLGVNCGIFNFPDLLAKATPRTSRPVFFGVLFHSRTTRTPRELAALDAALRAAGDTPNCEVLTIAEAALRYPDEIRQMNLAAKNSVPQDEVAGSARARVTIYRRAMAASAPARGLTRDYATADAHYAAGRYTEAEQLSPEIDRQCARLLRAGRAAAATAGLLAVSVVTLLLASAPTLVRASACGLACALVGGAGLLGWYQSTAPDTKREVAMGTAFALAGAIAGGVLVEIVRRLL